MKVELFRAPGCRSCAQARDALKSVAEQAIPGLVWCDIDVLQRIDYAVELGVLGVPALAVDGELAFSSLPTPAQLLAELRRRTTGADHGR